MVKKNIAVFFCAVLLILSAVGCGNNEENAKIEGVWIPTSAVINGNVVQYEELDIEDNQFLLSFDPNGKCEMTLTGITHSGSYTFSGTSVDIITKSEEYKLDYNSGTLTLSIEDENNPMSVSFIKSRD